MSEVLACIDGSSYGNSVCDHAAWFAGQMDAAISVVKVGAAGDARREPEPAGLLSATPLPGDVQHAVERLRDEGAPQVTGQILEGDFLDTVIQSRAELVVMGKRGAAHEEERAVVGGCVEPVMRATTAPICFTSKTFLHIDRALVVLDADMSHRGAVEFIASHPRLKGMRTDIVIFTDDGVDPGPKADWAREMLAAAPAEIYPVPAEGPDEAVARYMETRVTDLILISREVLLRGPDRRLAPVAEQGVWAHRTPVLVC